MSSSDPMEPGATPAAEAAAEAPNRRVLVVGDDASIHSDMRRILGSGPLTPTMDALESAVLGTTAPTRFEGFELAFATHGQAGHAQVVQAVHGERPYAMAFLDVRESSGWSGVEAATRILQDDGDIVVILLSAHADYGWGELDQVFGDSDRLLVLEKPLDVLEVRHLARALRRRWERCRRIRGRARELEVQAELVARELAEAQQRLRDEVAARQRLEGDLRTSQRLEAVGQLSAGIAHEINTPMQYLGDNVHFITSAFNDVWGLLPVYKRAREALAAAGGHDALVAESRAAEEGADLAYLEENVPAALGQMLDGVTRVSSIVRSMKEFSVPDSVDRAPADLNKAIENMLTVARAEYKYVADVSTDLRPLPAVMCNCADINQVLLAVLVNAAHAISDVVDKGGARGKITIRTRREEDSTVSISVKDTGPGIPQELHSRIFAPGFTTKPVGRGTGRGLAIARSIVDLHGGTISFDTELGRGTTFHIRLPVGGSGARRGTV